MCASMYEIHDNVLNNLKCSKCDFLLSVPPIFLLEDGTSVCGRCEPSSEEIQFSIRDKPYEEVAKILLFPCKFKNKGCNEKVKFEDTKKHEDSCKYAEITCPEFYNLEICDWEGSRNSLLKHFQEKHPQLIVQHPYYKKPEFNKVTNLLMVFQELLFLIQLYWPAVHGEDTLWHCVSLVGDFRILSNFKYCLEIKKGENIIKQNYDVISIQRFPDLVSDAYKKGGILKCFGHEDLSLSIRLLPKHTICNLYKTISTPFGLCCQECKNEPEDILQFPCPNLGCLYVANEEYSLRKHFKWLCKFQEFVCPLCKENIKSGCVMDHYIKSPTHEVITLPEEGNMSTLKINDVEINSWKSILVSTFNTVFRIYYAISDKDIFLKIVSNLEANNTKNIKIILNILSKGLPNYSTICQEEVQNISQTIYTNRHAFDWRICVKFDETIIRSGNNFNLYFLKLYFKRN